MNLLFLLIIVLLLLYMGVEPAPSRRTDDDIPRDLPLL